MKIVESAFVGRTAELSFLEERYAASGGQLVILYGRRRIGKTETILRFCRGKEAFFFTCTQTDDASQLRNFSAEMLSRDIPQRKYVTVFSGWEQAFMSVVDLSVRGDMKKILVIDEFPYMVRVNPEIASILQKVWDRKLKGENVMVILCGSSMSYMEKEILSEKNPLYGRSTGIYKMLPMPFADSSMFVPSWSCRDKVLAFAIFGGVPYYMSLLDESLTLKENVCSRILRKGSVLYSEPEFLIRQELREPSTYNTVIRAVACGKTAFNEIRQSTMMPEGKLSVYLKNLIELGIVEREFPVSCSERFRQNAGRGSYRLKDSFFRFWYRYVLANYSSVEFGDYGNVYDLVIEPDLNNFAALAFEDVCREWLMKRNMERSLPFAFTRIGRWWDKDVEIDIVAIGADKSRLISAECKFHNSAANDSDLKRHVRKDLSSLEVKKGAEVFFWFFSLGGFTDGAVEFARENGVSLVSGEELLAGFRSGLRA